MAFDLYHWHLRCTNHFKDKIRNGKAWVGKISELQSFTLLLRKPLLLSDIYSRVK